MASASSAGIFSLNSYAEDFSTTFGSLWQAPSQLHAFAAAAGSQSHEIVRDFTVPTAGILQTIIQAISHAIFSFRIHWYQTPLLLVFWEIRRIAWTLWWKAPSNVQLVGLPTPLGKWFTAMRNIYDSETVLQEEYDSCGGKPFAIPMIDQWIVYVCDRKRAEQLEHEPDRELSMEEALHELAFTEPILGSHKISPERNGSG